MSNKQYCQTKTAWCYQHQTASHRFSVQARGPIQQYFTTIIVSQTSGTCTGVIFVQIFKEDTVMKIEKLKSGSYRIRKMYKGITYTVVTDYKPTQKEAMRLLADEMDKVQSRKYHMTFETAARSYIEVKNNVLSPSTVKGYYSTINNLSKKFKNLIISDITSVDVQKEINDYSKTRSAKTVRNAHGLISAVLSMYAPNTILNTTLPMYVKKEPYIPTDEDIKALMGEAKGTEYEIPLILAAFGLRRSEICALEISDISDGTIAINKAMVLDSKNQWIKKETKTATGTRTITVPKEVTEKIKEHGYVYKGYPGNILKFMTQTQDKLGLPHFSLHKLRHYYASVSHSLGIPDAYIMRSGGWKTDGVLKSVYRHALSDKQEEMEKKSGDYIKNLVI